MKSQRIEKQAEDSLSRYEIMREIDDRGVIRLVLLDESGGEAAHSDVIGRSAQQIVDLLQRIRPRVATSFEIETRTGIDEFIRQPAIRNLVESNIVTSDIVHGGYAMIGLTSVARRNLEQS